MVGGWLVKALKESAEVGDVPGDTPDTMSGDVQRKTGNSLGCSGFDLYCSRRRFPAISISRYPQQGSGHRTGDNVSEVNLFSFVRHIF